ncbi:acyl carrier protein [Paenibacillus tengchongensis]|uniref:acyl carrier protein n=1 Tax=Paenibacillus tengchongensis TaxID=2608684 RepID=UPI00124C96BC|nr:phosphopantetheine-binding protein [Paenibacillus tengchongensis]
MINLEERVREIITGILKEEDLFEEDPENIVRNLTQDDDLQNIGLNSFMIIKIVVALETEFKFEFADEELESLDRLNTIGKLVKYIRNTLG